MYPSTTRTVRDFSKVVCTEQYCNSETNQNRALNHATNDYSSACMLLIWNPDIFLKTVRTHYLLKNTHL